MSKKFILFSIFILFISLAFEFNLFFNKKEMIEKFEDEKKFYIDSVKKASVKKKYSLEEIYEICILLIEKSQIKNAVLSYKKDAVQINIQSNLQKIIYLLNAVENLDYVPKIKSFYLKNLSETNCVFLIECNAEKKDLTCNLDLQNLSLENKSSVKNFFRSESKIKNSDENKKFELCSVQLVSIISVADKKYFWVRKKDGSLLKICQEHFLAEDENYIQIISDNKHYEIKKR